MSLITINQLSYSIGSRTILDSVNWTLAAGKKYGLVGVNGSGKTTLVRHILGEIESADGKIKKQPQLKTGYVPQYLPELGNVSVADYLLTNVRKAAENLSKTEEALAHAKENELEALLETYQQQNELFENAGGYLAETRCFEVLSRLGFENSPDQLVSTLSGGEQSLILFASALTNNPDLLILDEPGNHLDFLGLAWLEKFLASWPGTVLVVSHNRYFLDRVCTEIGEMENAKLSVYHGNYSYFKLEKTRSCLVRQNEFLQKQRLATELKKKIAELQGISMSMYNPPPRISAELAAAQKKLGSILSELDERPVLDNSSFQWSIEGDKNKSTIAMQIKDCSVSAGNQHLVDIANFEILVGERVALVGANGSGKTTLVNYILNNAAWDSSFVRIGPSQKIGYFSQQLEFEDDSFCLLDEIRSWGSLSRDDAYRLIAGFHFTYQDLDKKLNVLSGGEKNRLQLAKLAYQGANFLILDEPTNHLDIWGCESIEQALSEFKGTLLVVSHDRYFLDKIVNRVVEISNKRLEDYSGNFSQFFKSRYPLLPKLKGDLNTRKKEKQAAAISADGTAAHKEKKILEAENRRSFLEKKLELAYEKNNLAEGKELAKEIDALNQKIIRFYEEL